MVIDTSSLEYQERLKELNLTTLALRRRRGDLIQIYKIFKKIDDININIGSVTQNRYHTCCHNFFHNFPCFWIFCKGPPLYFGKKIIFEN